MRFRVAILTLAWLAAGPCVTSRAETPEEIFNAGNSAYEKGNYEEAAAAYRRVAQYGIVDGRVEYNLGNAAFKLGRLGEAILHYERALRLSPGDADVEANLELARARRFDRVEAPQVAAPIRIALQLQARVGPDRLALTVLVLVWAAAGLVAWRSARPGGWNAFAGWVLAGLVAAIAVTSVSWFTTYRRIEGTPAAVVLQDTVDVLAGPGQNNASIATVHEGLSLEVLAEREEWVQVGLPNGLNGWVPREALGFV